MKHVKHILLAFLLCVNLPAGELPSQLTPSDLDRMVEVIGLTANSRILRSAEPYKSWPGVKLGFELLFVPTSDLNSLGDGRGTLSSVTILPRIFLSKGLFAQLEIMANFFPMSTVNSLSTYGIGAKWTAMTERQGPFSAAAFANYTSIDGFGTYDGSNFELGALLSKDYVKFKPYAGAGLVFASGTVPAGLAVGDNSASENSIHLFGGVEVELPVNLTVQVDLMNVALSVSMFVGKRF